MAAVDATVFLVKDQAFRVYGVIKDSTTIDAMVGGVTLTATICKDGASFAPIAGTITEVDTSGYFHVDGTAADAAMYGGILRVTAAESNSVPYTFFLNFADLTEPTGHWLSQTVKRLEQGIVQGASYLLNRIRRDRTTGTITLYDKDGVSVGTFTATDDGTTLEKGKMT